VLTAVAVQVAPNALYEYRFTVIPAAMTLINENGRSVS